VISVLCECDNTNVDSHGSRVDACIPLGNLAVYLSVTDHQIRVKVQSDQKTWHCICGVEKKNEEADGKKRRRNEKKLTTEHKGMKGDVKWSLGIKKNGKYQE